MRLRHAIGGSQPTHCCGDTTVTSAPTTSQPARKPADSDAAQILRAVLATHDLDVEETEPGHFVVVLPGERKQRTTCSIVAGEHALTVQAFVARHVDENTEAVFRWLLERNLRMLDTVIRHMTVLLGKDIDAAAVTVDPEEIKVRRIELSSEDDERDESFEAQLGLADDGRREHHRAEPVAEVREPEEPSGTPPAEA